MALLSVVVPCYNEQDVIESTYRRLVGALNELPGLDHEMVFVDDGSRDETRKLLASFQRDDPQVRVITLARNFGHQLAVTCGIEHASGNAVVLIDADLQDPPEVIAQMVQLWRKGYDVVYGVRTDRPGESVFKLWTARLFYRLIARLSETPIAVDTGDFRLMDRKVVDALMRMPERDRFLRGMVGWVGFEQVGLPYRREPRAGGESKYPLAKMMRFAIDGITSFSTVPLRVATWMGFSAAALALVLSLWALAARIFTTQWVPGWAALFIAVLFMGGVQLMALGVIGEYVGRTYLQGKQRPLYVVADKRGFETSTKAPTSHPGAAAASAMEIGSPRTAHAK